MKKIVVLGGGISGYGSAILAKKKGFDVFLSDKGRIADRYKAKLDQWQVPYEEGHHSEERILAADEVVKSPGIPDKAPLIVKLREAGIPVISEMEFAGRYLGKARTICVTGSNGKTTTTSLIYKILRDAGYNVALGGNIGESFAYSVATGDYDWYVLELSSFQLDGMFRFRAHIGVLTNITPDHLDRYDYCFQNYVDAKMRITQNQNSRDFFIYSGDDEVIWQQLPKYDLRMKQLPFAAKNAVASGAGDAFLLDGKFTATVGRESVEIDTAKMRIPGLHNAYNAVRGAAGVPAVGPCGGAGSRCGGIPGGQKGLPAPCGGNRGALPHGCGGRGRHAGRHPAEAGHSARAERDFARPAAVCRHDPHGKGGTLHRGSGGSKPRQGKAGAPVCQLLSAGRRKRFAAVRKACKAGCAGRERRRHPRRGGAQRCLHCHRF